MTPSARTRLATLALAVAALTACAAEPEESPSTSWATPGTSSSSAPPASAAGSTAGRATEIETLSLRLAADLEAGRTRSTLDVAGSTLTRAGLTESALETARDQAVAQAGAFRRILGAYTVAAPEGDVVAVIAEHARTPMRLQFSYERDTTLLNGVYLQPATREDVARATSSGTPAPTATTAAAGRTGTHARDITVEVGEHRLPGTLARPATAPARPVAVLLLPGSGPQDRDGTIGSTGRKPLRDIADGLAAQGITTLRFDKRTKAAPQAFGPSATVADEYLDDAAAAVRLLRERPELRGAKIVALGHSQGAMVLPTILAADRGLAGGISLAGSPRSLFDIGYDQAAAATAAASDATPAQKAERLAAARRTRDAAKKLTDPVGTPPPELAGTLSAAYIASLNRLAPVADARATSAPLLFLQGEADRQVDVTADFGRWKTALADRPGTTFRAYPGLDHHFMPPAPAGPGHVDPTVVRDIAAWVAAR